MKRFAVGLAVCIAIGAATMQTATAKPRACTDYRVTPSMGAEWRRNRVVGLIRCVFTKVGIPSQIPEALYIADRESSYYPWAWNRSSDCRGLFQHVGWAWHGRALSYLPLRQFPRRATTPAFNARANAWVAAVMVRRGGWGPWSL